MRLQICLLLFFGCACQSTKSLFVSNVPSFISIIDKEHPLLKPVFDKPDHFEVQIEYTQINRDQENLPHFKSIPYRLNSEKYYYPASSVKMPTAFAALECLESIEKSFGVHLNSPFEADSATAEQSSVKEDLTSKDGKASIGHYVKKIFLVSDNDAYNRLYEFVGQERLNKLLYGKGLRETVIRHRLSAPQFNFLSNQVTNPIRIYGEQQVYAQPLIDSKAYHIPKFKEFIKGRGYYKNGQLISEPFNFKEKNFISIKDQTSILQRILFPTYYKEHERFEISESSLAFLYDVMSMVPRASDFPKYPEGRYEDSYVKFFLFGDSKKRIPDHIKIFNKVGYAYGYLTDIAYIIDLKNNVEFMLSATIHVNENQIYNDNTYEYNDIGIPFLAELGRQIYAYELKRKRKHIPNLNRFK